MGWVKLGVGRRRPVMQDIAVTVHTFKEANMFVAYVPELDLSSCGTTE